MDGVKAYLRNIGHWHYTQSTVQQSSSSLFADTALTRNKNAIAKALRGVTRPDTIPAEVALLAKKK